MFNLLYKDHDKNKLREGDPSALNFIRDKILIMDFGKLIGTIFNNYTKSTPVKIKLIDSYIIYCFISGVIVFCYCALVGTFPFNSFLSAFVLCITSFVLGLSLRLQTDPSSAHQFQITPHRALAEFLFTHVITLLAVVNFLG
ncbi:hypothetical protein GJ496_004367 [Pomphorhynchus laevis]|nr:hypothetical protein GJ496_004367 [Pomphorhynchus laevis]